MIMLLIDCEGIPPATDNAGTTRNELNLIEPLLQRRVLNLASVPLRYGTATVSDHLRQQLQLQPIELVCQHRSKPS